MSNNCVYVQACALCMYMVEILLLCFLQIGAATDSMYNTAYINCIL